ncbi:PAS domain-containing sensor histidine kinase [Nakamurella antarctica]|nr:PAS domain S-box protein [Nakamurella antarctica]
MSVADFGRQLELDSQSAPAGGMCGAAQKGWSPAASPLRTRPSAASEASGELQPLYKAILDSAMDAVVTIDHHGRILEWNISAELIFGYRADEVLGRELCDLIIPAKTRHLHRAGLHSIASGGVPTILDQRVEVIGQRADGTEIPVELSITRVISTAGVMYCGFLRDISDRKKMLEDLKASRSRLITVSDDTRRRVERDLHDGAQQQLVAVAIALGNARNLIDSDPSSAATTIELASEVLVSAIAELRELARGIHSSTLADHGLPVALQELGRRSAIPVQVRADMQCRVAKHVETSIYFMVSEALTNAAKHGARSALVVVDLVPRPQRFTHQAAVSPQWVLRCVVSDDGPGGVDLNRGTGLRGLFDRLAAVDGTLTLDSSADAGTTLTAIVPAPLHDLSPLSV